MRVLCESITAFLILSACRQTICIHAVDGDGYDVVSFSDDNPTSKPTKYQVISFSNDFPTNEPIREPTNEPTNDPTNIPTIDYLSRDFNARTSTESPTESPNESLPTASPTEWPTYTLTEESSSSAPIKRQTGEQTGTLTGASSSAPTTSPSSAPTKRRITITTDRGTPWELTRDYTKCNRRRLREKDNQNSIERKLEEDFCFPDFYQAYNPRCPKDSPFDEPDDVALVSSYVAPEVSGLASSRINPGILWGHNDYDNHHELLAIEKSTGYVYRYELRDGNNYDFEDMSRAPCPGSNGAKDCLFLADIGDNYYRRNRYNNPITIYRVVEPKLRSLGGGRLDYWDKLELEFSDGPHNSESIIVDPISERIIITTVSSGSIWITPRPWGEGSDRMTLMKVGRIKERGDYVTGMDISPDGKELVHKGYENMYYFCFRERSLDDPDGAWTDIVAKLTYEKPEKVKYEEEYQGEAVTFGAGFDDGIYTLSESRGRKYVPLKHYARR